jgi:protoheme IX farnesyltransferase
MSSAPQTVWTLGRSTARRLDAVVLLELTKPRLAAMVLVTTAAGFYLAARGPVDVWLLLATLVGTGLAGAGSLVLNQYVERDLDARMERTAARPIPSGRIDPQDALLFGAALTAGGLAILALAVNTLAGLVTAVTVVAYLALYTPMKRWTPLCAIVGAVPGALPPVTGWVAASGALEPGAWAIFGILFLWQLPHSLAIARLYEEDYARAGFKLLPVIDRGGRSTERQILVHSAALLVAGLVPSVVGVSGVVYFAVALVLGTGLLAFSVDAAVRPSKDAVRRLLFATLVYLPVLLGAMALDKV